MHIDKLTPSLTTERFLQVLCEQCKPLVNACIIAKECSSVECARARVSSHIAKLLLRVFRNTGIEIAHFDWSDPRPFRNVAPVEKIRQ